MTMEVEVTWIGIKDALVHFGMGEQAARNSISRGKFPVPTYKLGKKRVIDKAVLAAYFEAKRAEGLAALANTLKS